MLPMLKKLQKVQESFGAEIPSPDNVPPVAHIENDKYCPVYLVSDGNNKPYKCFISSSIVEVNEYFDLLDILSTATENDTVVIYIDSPGGYIATGATIASMITSAKCKVITVAVGICASAGSLIWSAGHVVKVEPTAVLMYHMSSHGDGGNSLKIETEARAMVEYVKRACLSVAVSKGHLLQEEMDLIVSDPDREVHIPASVMIERLANQQGGM